MTQTIAIPDQQAFWERPPQSSAESESNPFLRRLRHFDRAAAHRTAMSSLSLFSGGGGLDLGLAFAGFECALASDLAPVFVETIASNLEGTVAYPADAMELTGAALRAASGHEEVDLIAAGPPCQAFSILGRRGALADPRGLLALKYFELVAELKPRAFLFENVPGLLTTNSGADWERLLTHANDVTGYDLHWAKLNAASFGIPQFRERVVVVGFREPRLFEFPRVPTGPGASELLEMSGGLSPSRWALEGVDGLPNHRIRAHGERVRNRYHAMSPGARDRTDHTDRIHPDRPSGTVLVGSSDGGGRPHVHPWEPRVITVREAARLQSFPDWYVFRGTGTAQYRQVGNAVPPLLAYEVGCRIRDALNGQ